MQYVKGAPGRTNYVYLDRSVSCATAQAAKLLILYWGTRVSRGTRGVT